MSKSPIRQLLVAMIMVSIACNSLQLHAEESAETTACNPGPGTVLAFFNGVLTTESGARNALRALKQIHGEIDGTGQKLQYENMYNYTNGFEDFVETFDQRMREQG